METKNEAQKRGQRITIVKAIHPTETVQAKFTNPKPSHIADWLFSLSERLPKSSEVVPILQWVPKDFIHGMKTGFHPSGANSGQLFGLTVYIYNY